MHGLNVIQRKVKSWKLNSGHWLVAECRAGVKCKWGKQNRMEHGMEYGMKLNSVKCFLKSSQITLNVWRYRIHLASVHSQLPTLFNGESTLCNKSLWLYTVSQKYYIFSRIQRPLSHIRRAYADGDETAKPVLRQNVVIKSGHAVTGRVDLMTCMNNKGSKAQNLVQLPLGT